MSKEIKYLVEERSNELSIFSLLKLVKQNLKLVGILFSILFFMSLAYILTRPKEYYSSYPIDMNKQVSSTVVNDLKNASKFSKNDLKASLNFTDEELKSLNFIQISNIIIGEEKHSATINLSVKNAEYLNIILQKLVSWASENPKVKKTISQKKQSIEGMIQKADEQLVEIKALKIKVLADDNSDDLKQPTQISFVGEFSIFENKQKLIEELNNLEAIQIDSQIYSPSEAKNASPIIPIFFAFIFSLLISLIAAVLIKFDSLN